MSVSVLRRAARPLASVLLSTTAILAVPTAAVAQSEREAAREFSIPGGELNAVLLAFAEEADLTLAFDPAIMQGVTSPGLSGRHTVRGGLGQLLDGTGFTYRFTGSSSVSIQPVGLDTPASAPDPTPSRGEAVRLEGVTVVDTAVLDEESYSPAPSSIALKTDLPLRQTPFTINQVTEEIIEERGDVDIFETLENFAGVTTVSTNADIGQGISRSINIRGFNISDGAALLINGQRAYSLGSQNRDPANLARVELLRGPAALYYGAGEPGGIINYVYKRPLAEARYKLRANTDTAGSYGGSIDVGGPITSDGTLRYRAVGNYRNYEDDQDYIFSESISGLAALSLVPNDQFRATITYEYYDFESVTEQENNKRLEAVPGEFQDIVQPGEYFPVPRDFFFGQPDDRANRTSHTVIADLEWRPADDLRVRAFGNFQHADEFLKNTRILGGGRNGGPTAINPDGTVSRYTSFGGRNSTPESEVENYTAGLDVAGSFETFGIAHEWLVGGGYGKSRERSKVFPPDVRCLFEQQTEDPDCVTDDGGNRSRELAPPDLDIFDPEHSDWEGDFLLDQAVTEPRWSEREDYNLFVQDVITLPNDTTRFVAAIGWSRYENYSPGSIQDFDTLELGEDSTNEVEAWSPRFAVMQDFGASTTVYASFGESFAPQGLPFAVDQQGEPLSDPERGRQYEIGVKRDLLGGAGLVQAAIFRLEKENVTRAANPDTCDANIADPANPDFCYSVLDGLQRSDGVEISAQGQLTSWWSASLGYSYLDATIVETNDEANRGKQLPYVPEHSVTLWNRFDVVDFGDGGKLGAGAGLKFWSEVTNGYDDDGTTDINPSYELVDVGIDYTNPVGGVEMKIIAQVNNLFDTTYYDRRRYRSSGTIVWGNERRAFLNLQYTF